MLYNFVNNFCIVFIGLFKKCFYICINNTVIDKKSNMETKIFLGLILLWSFLIIVGFVGILLAIKETKRYNKSIDAEADLVGQLFFIASISIVKLAKSISNKRTKNEAHP